MSIKSTKRAPKSAPTKAAAPKAAKPKAAPTKTALPKLKATKGEPKDSAKAKRYVEQVFSGEPQPKRPSRLERALAIMDRIPDAPGSEAKLKALEKGIAEARHPGRKP
jgi:hypothetical protein